MDALNTFFIFNVAASFVALAAFSLMRDGAMSAVTNAGKRVASFNYAGATGAVTSLALLTSVAVLFR
jgi:hypothetical protein